MYSEDSISLRVVWPALKHRTSAIPPSFSRGMGMGLEGDAGYLNLSEAYVIHV